MSFFTLPTHKWMIDCGTLQGNVNLFFELSLFNSGRSLCASPSLFSLLAYLTFDREGFSLFQVKSAPQDAK